MGLPDSLFNMSSLTIMVVIRMTMMPVKMLVVVVMVGMTMDRLLLL